jgi:hypothetical protein
LLKSANRFISRNDRSMNSRIIQMCRWWSNRGESSVVESDVARAKSMVIGLRAKLDKVGRQKIHAYGRAVLHVANLLSETFDLTLSNAVSGRAVSTDDLDGVYRDLLRSVRRCEQFLSETSPSRETAEELATACSILKHLYRMRYHARTATGRLQLEAEDSAERLMTLTCELLKLGYEAQQMKCGRPKRIAA